ncbi:hypothetical protein E2C01_047136 [Portunus trituberculatus]|uniref:Uncharacterized protein n=1 Tax=Portunus trituberculatus TaxID=210409 RepID=A0A5B7G6Q5_PORTR|nr:hypothetical protein [Portunus trituberculatus]
MRKEGKAGVEIEKKRKMKEYFRSDSEGWGGKAKGVAWNINIPLDLGMTGREKLRGGAREGKEREVKGRDEHRTSEGGEGKRTRKG